MQKMRSYHVEMGKGLNGISFREHAIPVPGPGEALVRVKACSLNYREIMIIFQGVYPLPVRSDVIPLSDGAGEVVEVGEGTTRVKPGDPVVASIFPDWTHGPFSLANAAQLGGSLNGMLSALNLKCPLQNMEKIGLDEISHLPMGAGYLSSDFYRRIREVEEQESQKVQEAETEVKEP